jgi:Matrixin
MSEPTLSGNQELVERELTERLQARTNPFKLRNPEEAARKVEPQMHVYGRAGAQCITDTSLGKRSPQDRRDPFKLVVGIGGPGEGNIPLWAEDTTLRWRFRERSLARFEDPEGAKSFIQELFGAALLAWGDATPVRFVYGEEVRGDFEVAMNWCSDCTTTNGSTGCVLASAFFPARAHERLWLYPEMFEQSVQEMIETLVHELGHCFGLRHYFAPEEETDWPAVVFGTHKPFSIMNYGSESVLTEADRDDLKRLYEAAWSGKINNIGGLPIRLVEPLSAT